MGLWFFLSVAFAGHLMLKAYKLRMHARSSLDGDRRIAQLEQELNKLKMQSVESHAKRLEQLEEAVYFGDFELKQKFKKLEDEMGKARI